MLLLYVSHAAFEISVPPDTFLALKTTELFFQIMHFGFNHENKIPWPLFLAAYCSPFNVFIFIPLLSEGRVGKGREVSNNIKTLPPPPPTPK
jgi:hypothetical protein